MRINTVSCEEEFVRKAVLWPAAEGKALWAGEVGRGRMDHEDSSFSTKHQTLETCDQAFSLQGCGGM